MIFYTDYYLFTANSMKWRQPESSKACVGEEHVWCSASLVTCGASDSALFFAQIMFLGCVCTSDSSN